MLEPPKNTLMNHTSLNTSIKITKTKRGKEKSPLGHLILVEISMFHVGAKFAMPNELGQRCGQVSFEEVDEEGTEA